VSRQRRGVDRTPPVRTRRIFAVVVVGGTVASLLGGCAVSPSTSRPSSRASLPPASTTTTIAAAVGEIASWPISGPPQAKQDIRAALRLIERLRDTRYWKVVTSYHGRFVADHLDFGISPYDHTIEINDQERRNYNRVSTGDAAQDRQNAANSRKWLASSIIHESYQGWLYTQGQPWFGAQAENDALRLQAAALRAMHADSNAINWVNNEIDPNDEPGSYWNRYRNGRIVAGPQGSANG
jgi:hypothetical protein